METLEIIILIVALLILISIIFFIVSSEFRYALILKRGGFISRYISRYLNHRLEKYGIDLSWWDDFDVEELQIKAIDGINLAGYFLDNNGSKDIALVIHGYGEKAIEMQPYVKMFYDKGYSVLAVDNRAHGQSEGRTITMGYYDQHDAAKWVEYLVDRFPDCNVVVFGLSMGGATACLYSAHTKPSNVKAIISDCAYSSAYDVIDEAQKVSVVFGIPPLMNAFDHYSEDRMNFKLSDIDVKEQVKKCNVPILLIHGSKDKFVPFYMRDVIYENVPENLRQKLTIDNAAHAQSIAVDNEKYIQTVYAFLDEFVNKKSS